MNRVLAILGVVALLLMPIGVFADNNADNEKVGSLQTLAPLCGDGDAVESPQKDVAKKYYVVSGFHGAPHGTPHGAPHGNPHGHGPYIVGD